MSKDYTKYEVLDFVDDSTFVEFVLKTNSESIDFWNQWISDHPEALDKINQASEFLQSVQIDEPEIDHEKIDDLWSRIDHSIDQGQGTSARIVRRLSIWRYVAAASILLLVGLWMFWPNYDQYKTSFAVTEKVQLPDQSTVNLNAASKLTFKRRSWNEIREVNLSGEAFFEVEKGSRFVVNTELGQVEVLGTSFNVLNRGDYFEVQCITGSVRVRIKDQNMSQEIIPNEAVFYNHKTGAFNIKSISGEPSLWISGVVNFEDKPIDFVFDELERQYNVKINDESISGNFTGNLTLNDLNQALYDLCWPMKLNYQIENNQVTVTK